MANLILKARNYGDWIWKGIKIQWLYVQLMAHMCDELTMDKEERITLWDYPHMLERVFGAITRFAANEKTVRDISVYFR